MPRPGRFFVSLPDPAFLARGLIFVAMMLAHAPVTASQAPGSGDERPVDQDGTLDQAQEKARALFESIEWGEGPGTVELGTVASIRVPSGFLFTKPAGAKTLLELGETPPPENLLGVLVPAESVDWIVIFTSSSAPREGDGKAKPDADALLKTLRAENEKANAIRRTHGWSVCTEPQWEVPPSYEGSRHNLTWATRFDDGDETFVNDATRILGPSGAIEAHLLVRPKDFARVHPTVANILTLVEFPGEARDNDEPSTRPADSETSGFHDSRRKRRIFMKSGRLIGVSLVGAAVTIFGGLKKLRNRDDE